MKAFDVDVYREARFWVGQVRGVRGGATEVRRLENLRGEIVDLLSGLLDLDPESVELRMHYEHALGPAAMKRLGEYDEAAVDLARAQGRYETAQAEVVSELRAGGVSLRDAGTLLRVSFQRVQQLTRV